MDSLKQRGIIENIHGNVLNQSSAINKSSVKTDDSIKTPISPFKSVCKLQSLYNDLTFLQLLVDEFENFLNTVDKMVLSMSIVLILLFAAVTHHVNIA